MKLYLSLLLLFIFLVIAFVFGTQNPQPIELNYIVARSELTVAEAVSIFTFIGFMIGIFTILSVMVARKLKRKKNKPSIDSQQPINK